MNQVYLSLGSNIDNREQYLKSAIRYLRNDNNIFVEKISSVYETSPVSKVKQSDFLNLVLKVSTKYDSMELLDQIHIIEKRLNRKRVLRWGPRTIDMDILYFNVDCLVSDVLQIPHKEIENRLFVMVPLLEICENDFYKKKQLVECVSKLKDTKQKIKKWS
ncbi:hypothetical protein JP39_08410 [Companilactobacillus heilongjiangensis]|uniref:2-amino-4-hydroxy-6-hydroxymethyldihydropteridine diphosphokinase n=1 Tax=Companilactobacillus heilongjiangensis TaxID=1074467 RepID=A0A0K2LDV9_9LACO|nr:2-amino-4-hydroxy-6-hydroxymethyldihydropteridine diphosphokinase [Companilactobacillus heilongjiangensis]ALB29373.1 hypothetical protein JP39_08410 [Companilactobacillus heilongjiangensis]